MGQFKSLDGQNSGFENKRAVMIQMNSTEKQGSWQKTMDLSTSC